MNDYRDKLPKIEEPVDQKIQELLNSQGEECLKTLVARLRDRRAKLQLSSSTTDRVLGICTTLLGFGAAGLGLSIGFVDKIRQLEPIAQKIIVAAGTVYFELVILSLIILFVYLSQARFRYPYLYFKKIGNTWPWFYYATVSPEISRSPFQGSSKRLAAAQHYADDYLTFAGKVVGETKTEEVRNELQQYYLLLSYQGYVQQFSLRLTNIFFYGLFGAIGSAVVLAAWMVFA